MTLVVVARYYDLPSARLAESFLRDAGLSPSIADDALTTVDPLLLRAVGGLRLSVPETQVDTARDLLARVEAGEFATPVDDDNDLIEPRQPTMPVPLIGLLALAFPAAAYGGLRRGGRSHWVKRIGVAIILLTALGLGGIALYDRLIGFG